MQKVHVAGGHGYKFEQIYDFSNDLIVINELLSCIMNKEVSN